MVTRERASLNAMRWLGMSVALAVGAGCAADSDGGPPAETMTPDAAVVAETPAVGLCAGSAQVTSVLTYGGDLDVTCEARAVTAKPASAEAKEHLSISAPIWPKVLILYQAEGSWPQGADALAKLAHDASLTFAQLLDECPG